MRLAIDTPCRLHVGLALPITHQAIVVEQLFVCESCVNRRVAYASVAIRPGRILCWEAAPAQVFPRVWAIFFQRGQLGQGAALIAVRAVFEFATVVPAVPPSAVGAACVQEVPVGIVWPLRDISPQIDDDGERRPRHGGGAKRLEGGTGRAGPKAADS